MSDYVLSQGLDVWAFDFDNNDFHLVRVLAELTAIKRVKTHGYNFFACGHDSRWTPVFRERAGQAQ